MTGWISLKPLKVVAENVLDSISTFVNLVSTDWISIVIGFTNKIQIRYILIPGVLSILKKYYITVLYKNKLRLNQNVQQCNEKII